MTGSRSHSWWAMGVLLLVDGAIFASFAFSFLYLWTISPEWPPPGIPLADAAWSLWAASGWLLAGVLVWLAARALRAASGVLFDLALLGGLLALGGAFYAQLCALGDISPRGSGYGATLYALLSWQGFHVVVVAIMALYTLARRWSGRLDAQRRVNYDNTALMWLYTAAQGLVSLAVMASPRLAP